MMRKDWIEVKYKGVVGELPKAKTYGLPASQGFA